MKFFSLSLPAAVTVVAILGSGCTAPEQPLGDSNLTVVPSTLDFGVVRHGTYRDSVFSIVNRTSDTLRIMGGTRTDSAFEMDVFKSRLSEPLYPDSSKKITMRFSALDTLWHSSHDTLTLSNGKTLSYTLIGRGRPTDVNIRIETDTVDFGGVKLGTTVKDFIRIANLSKDPIQVSGITFSNAHFKAIDVPSIAPGSTGLLPVFYTPLDTISEYCTDTLTIEGHTITSILKGNGQRFSPLFTYPPYGIRVQLTDVFGRSDSTLYSFDFDADSDPAGSSGEMCHFSTLRQEQRNQSNSGFYKWYESYLTNVTLLIDSGYRVDSLEASYDDSFGDPWTSWHFSSSIRLHGVQLQRTGNKLIGEVEAASLPGVIDDLNYDCDAQSCIHAPWTGIVGYKATAKLRIEIALR